MDVASFDEIAGEFQARVARIAWATVATIAADGSPRTRVLHPIWDGPVGWIATTADSLKMRQIAREPRISLTYWDQQQDNIHIEAVASEVDDDATRARVWSMFETTPPPLGYDPALFWKAPDDAGFTTIRLDPVRVELTGLRQRGAGRPPQVWRP
jgi:general stress protein 26